MRLLNGDPQQQRSKEAAKQNYKRQLALQMQMNLKRKEQEKQKERELEEKYERAFYEQRKQLEQQQTDGQSKSPATNNANSGGQRQSNNRSVSEKYIGSPDRQSSLKDREAQRQFEYIDGLLAHKDMLTDQQAPNLLLKRQQRADTLQQSSVTNYQTKQANAWMLLPPDPAYQQQRLSSIQQFQESILKKVDQLRFDIGRAGPNNLEVNREVDRIRGMLRNRDILQYDASSLLSSQVSAQVRERFHSDGVPKQSRARRQIQYSPSLADSNASGGYRQLEALTEVRYPQRQNPSEAPVAMPSTFARIPQMKSQSSEAEDEQYDKVEVPDLPYRPNKPSVSQQGISKFAPQKSNAIRDVSFERAKFVPKSQIMDFKVENYLNNIQNLIDHYKD